LKSLPFQGTIQKLSARTLFFMLGGVLVLGVLSVLVYELSSQNNVPVIPPNPLQEIGLPVDPTATIPGIITTLPSQEILISAANTPLTSSPTSTALSPTSTIPSTIPTTTPVVQPSATSTLIPPTSTQATPCYQIGNLEDITIPGGTEILAGQAFTKTWIFQNTGSCTWSPDTRLVLASGALIYPFDNLELGESITPGMSWLLSLDVTAPFSPGTFFDTWKLYTGEGRAFINEDGQEQEFSILVTVLPSVAQISGRIVKDGIPVGAGVILSLEDYSNQAIAIASTSDDGTFTWTDVPASDQGYNLVFSQSANNQFGIDQALSWVWVGPVPVQQGQAIQLADIDISPLGFAQTNPEPEAVFSAAAITPSTPVMFQWSDYPGAVDYWVDLVNTDEANIWQSNLVSAQSASFDGTQTNSTHIQAGEYWWAVGARRWLGDYQQTVYTYLINMNIEE
jgi:Ig-like domain from next to BRCA1 gene